MTLILLSMDLAGKSPITECPNSPRAACHTQDLQHTNDLVSAVPMGSRKCQACKDSVPGRSKAVTKPPQPPLAAAGVSKIKKALGLTVGLTKTKTKR